MVTLSDPSGFLMHTVGAKYGLIEGSLKSAFSSFSSFALIAFLTAGEFNGVQLSQVCYLEDKSRTLLW